MRQVEGLGIRLRMSISAIFGVNCAPAFDMYRVGIPMGMQESMSFVPCSPFRNRIEIWKSFSHVSDSG